MYETVFKYLQEADLHMPNSHRPPPAGAVGPSAKPPDLNKKDRFEHLVQPASPGPEISKVVSINEVIEDALTRRCIPLNRKALDIVLSVGSPLASFKSARAGSPCLGSSRGSERGQGQKATTSQVQRQFPSMREPCMLARGHKYTGTRGQHDTGIESLHARNPPER